MFPLFIYFLLKTSYFTNKSGTQSFAHFLHIVESQHRKKKITSTNFDPFAGVQSKIGCLPLLNQKLVCSTSYSSSLKILLMVYLLGCVFFFFLHVCNTANKCQEKKYNKKCRDYISRFEMVHRSKYNMQYFRLGMSSSPTIMHTVKFLQGDVPGAG